MAPAVFVFNNERLIVFTGDRNIKKLNDNISTKHYSISMNSIFNSNRDLIFTNDTPIGYKYISATGEKTYYFGPFKKYLYGIKLQSHESTGTLEEIDNIDKEIIMSDLQYVIRKVKRGTFSYLGLNYIFSTHYESRTGKFMLCYLSFNDITTQLMSVNKDNGSYQCVEIQGSNNILLCFIIKDNSLYYSFFTFDKNQDSSLFYSQTDLSCIDTLLNYNQNNCILLSKSFSNYIFTGIFDKELKTGKIYLFKSNIISNKPKLLLIAENNLYNTSKYFVDIYIVSKDLYIVYNALDEDGQINFYNQNLQSLTILENRIHTNNYYGRFYVMGLNDYSFFYFNYTQNNCDDISTFSSISYLNIFRFNLLNDITLSLSYINGTTIDITNNQYILKTTCETSSNYYDCLYNNGFYYYIGNSNNEFNINVNGDGILTSPDTNNYYTLFTFTFDIPYIYTIYINYQIKHPSQSFYLFSTSIIFTIKYNPNINSQSILNTIITTYLNNMIIGKEYYLDYISMSLYSYDQMNYLSYNINKINTNDNTLQKMINEYNPLYILKVSTTNDNSFAYICKSDESDILQKCNDVLTNNGCVSSCKVCSDIGNDIIHKCDVCKDNYYKCPTCEIDEYSTSDISNNCYNERTIQNGYYLDTTDNIYKKCDSNCFSCMFGPTTINTQCIICKSGYTEEIKSTPSIYKKNCINIGCKDYQYIDYNNKCVDFCDNKYNIYGMFNNLRDCKDDTPDNYYLNIEKKAYYPCPEYCFLCDLYIKTDPSKLPDKDICQICKTIIYDFPTKSNLTYSKCSISLNIIKEIISNAFTIDRVIFYLYKDQQKVLDNTNIIDLSNIKNQIKDFNNLIIGMVEYRNIKNNKYTNYVLFNKYMKKIGLNTLENVYIVKSQRITEEIKKEMDEEQKYDNLGIDITDIENIFFNSKCIPYSESGNDVSLRTRITNIHKAVSVCGNGCTIDKEYNGDKEILYCTCKADQMLSKPEFANVTEEEGAVLNELSKINIGIIKCTQLFFDFDRLKSNIGFYFSCFTLLASFIDLIFFFVKDYIWLYVTFFERILLNPKIDKNAKLPNILEHLPEVPPKKQNCSFKIKSTKKNIFKISSFDENELNRFDINTLRTQKSKSNNTLSCNKKESKYNNIIEIKTDLKKRNNIQQKESYNIYKEKDINKLTIYQYKRYIKNNFRALDDLMISMLVRRKEMHYSYKMILVSGFTITFFDSLWELIREVEVGVRMIVRRDPFELQTMNILLFIFGVNSSFFLSGLFYSDDVIEEKEENGKISVITTITKMVYTTLATKLVCYFPNYFYGFMVRFDGVLRFSDRRKQLSKYAYYLIIYSKISISLFIILTLGFNLFFIYYISIFCVTFNGSAISWFYDGFLSLGFGMLMNLGFAAGMSVLRVYSIKYKMHYIYNIYLYSVKYLLGATYPT